MPELPGAIAPNPRWNVFTPFISFPQHLIDNNEDFLPGRYLVLETGERKFSLRLTAPESPTQQSILVNPHVYAMLQNPQYRVPVTTLGCDPEFFLVSKQKLVLPALCYLPHLGSVGSDGQLAELRPPFGVDELSVVESLRLLIQRVPEAITEFSRAHALHKEPCAHYLAASWYQGFAAGFHVHLGVPRKLYDSWRGPGASSLLYITDFLDLAVGLPLTLNEESNPRRFGQMEYGQPGDVRTKENSTLEYRTPGAYYLRSPQLAAAVMGLTALVGEFLFQKLTDLSNNFQDLSALSYDNLSRHILLPPDRTEIRALFQPQNSGRALTWLESISLFLQTLPNYSIRAKSVDPIFSFTLPNPSADLRENWKS